MSNRTKVSALSQVRPRLRTQVSGLAAALSIGATSVIGVGSNALPVGPAVPAAQAQTTGNGFNANASVMDEPIFTPPQVLAAPGEGFGCYRIPSIGTTPDGTILTSWDGRPASCQDAPAPNSIVGRTSTDNGQTWSEQYTISKGQATPEPVGYSDPSVIVDWETGDVFNFHVKSFDAGFIASRPGTDPEDRSVIQAAYAKSEDGGKTWQPDNVITDDITSDDAWFSRFATSGNGIQLQYGEHKGRLVQPATIRVAPNGYFASVMWISDDHGETWYPGEAFGAGMDESKVVELSDGTLMDNSRASDGNFARKISYSYDGGVTWTDPVPDTSLPDPHNNASLIRAFPAAAQNSAQSQVLLFSNTASTRARENGTLRMSCDDGQTWPVSRVFAPGRLDYSHMATLPDGNVGLMWEDRKGGTFSGMLFSKFNLAWLQSGCVGVTSTDQSDEAGIQASTTSTVELKLTNPHAQSIVNRDLEFDLPAGWTAKSKPVTIPANGTTTTEVEFTVPAGADNAALEIPVTINDGPQPYNGIFQTQVIGGEDPAGEDGEDAGPITMEVRDPQSEYRAGDVIGFDINVRNDTGQTVSFIPSRVEGDYVTENFRNFEPSATNPGPNCRWVDLTAGGRYTCTSATYTVSQEDVDRGFIEIATSWSVGDTTLEVNSPRLITTAEEPATDVQPNAIVALDPVADLSSDEGEPTATITARVSLPEGTEIPAGTTVDFYKDNELLATVPVDTEGLATTDVDFAAVAAGDEDVDHEILARVVVPEDSGLVAGRDARATVTVTAAREIADSRIIKLAEQPDVVDTGSEQQVTLVATATEADGSPVPAGTEVDFTVNGTALPTALANEEGIALVRYTVAPLAAGESERELTVTAEVAGVTTPDTTTPGAQAEDTFTLLHADDPGSSADGSADGSAAGSAGGSSGGSADGSSAASAVGSIVAILAAVGGIAALTSPALKPILDKLGINLPL